MSFVTHAQNKDALAFKALVEEKLAEKVVQVLEGLKIEVASNFFNAETVSEEGGTSGGVSQVWKKPAPGGKGKASAPEPKLSSGPKQDRKTMEPGSGLADEGGSPAVKEETQNSFKFEFQGLTQNLDEAVVLPGSMEHMAHTVHDVHVGTHAGMNGVGSLDGNHYETKHYHIHRAGYTPFNPKSKESKDKAIYIVHHKYSMAQNLAGDSAHKTHKFHVSRDVKHPNKVHVEHVGSLNNEEYMAEKGPIGPVKKGQMHKDLGKSPDAKITGKDIAKEKAKGGVFAKRATFAQNAKKWHHGK
jgi:hypothetical protein